MGRQIPLTTDNMTSLAAAMRQSAAFAMLTDEELRQVAKKTSMVFEGASGEFVYHAGERAGHFYFVLSGQVGLKAGGKRLRRYISGGEVFGYREIGLKMPRRSSAEVVVDARIAEFPLEALAWLFAVQPKARQVWLEKEGEKERLARAVFEEQQEDEVVVLLSSKSPAVLGEDFTAPVIMVILSILALSGIYFYLQTGAVLGNQDISLWVIYLSLVLAVVGLVWALIKYLDWRNDEYIVTSKRLIHIERLLFGGKMREETPLTRIQDMTVIGTSIWNRMFNYHDLRIKTAGAGSVVFKSIPNAEKVEQMIFDERQKASEREQAAKKTAIRQELAQRLASKNGEVQAAEAPAAGDISLPPGVETGSPLWNILHYLIPHMSDENEEQIIWRKHWIILIRGIALPLISLLTISYLIVAGIGQMFPLENMPGFPPGLWIALLLFLAGALVWYFYAYDNWYRDIYILTRDKIIDVESSSFRLRGEKIRAGSFDAIQNITYNIPNLLWRVLRMGDVVIETAGTAHTFTFEHVYNPEKVQQTIHRHMMAFQERRQQEEQEQNSRQMSDWLGTYHELMEEMNGVSD